MQTNGVLSMTTQARNPPHCVKYELKIVVMVLLFCCVIVTTIICLNNHPCFPQLV